MKEIWKSVSGYEGRYEVSSNGKVKSVERYKNDRGRNIKVEEKLLCQQKTRDGYLQVYLSKNGVTKGLRVHRLVALAFIPNPNKKQEVNHINEIKTDNRVCNLEWVTRVENANWGTKQKRFSEKMRNYKKYSKPVIGISMIDGSEISFPSAQEAKRQGFNQGNVNSCCRGERKSHKGYYWKFK
jgi:hypothetical protein